MTIDAACYACKSPLSSFSASLGVALLSFLSTPSTPPFHARERACGAAAHAMRSHCWSHIYRLLPSRRMQETRNIVVGGQNIPFIYLRWTRLGCGAGQLAHNRKWRASTLPLTLLRSWVLAPKYSYPGSPSIMGLF